MKSGILFAILSLSFAGVNDIFFKKYSQKDRSRGMFILGIGVVWVLLQSVALRLKTGGFAYDALSISFGLLAGAFLVVSNILLLESYTHIDISLGSTVYRLNTVVVVLLSFFLLDESLSAMKVLGILLGLISVGFLYQRSHSRAKTAHYSLFFLLAILAAFMRALYGVTTKDALLHHAEPQVMLFVIALSWIVGGAVYARVKEKRFRLTRKKLVYSAISGTLVFAIANFLMLAVERGQASVVIPIANMSFIVALIISVQLKMEKLTRKKGVAIAFAAASIISLSFV
jgi:drug/metabolite transporter (DMT)-like permease